MRTVDDLLKEALTVNIPLELELSMQETSEDYIRIQREQMSAGERNDGTPIFNVKTGSEYYSPSYAKYKGKDHPIDLKDIGDFQGGIFTTPEKGGLKVDSDDSKSGKLKENYGKEIFGLNEESLTQYGPIAQTRLIQNVKQDLKLS